MATQPVQLLPIRFHHALGGDGNTTRTVTVRCASRGGSVPLAECQTCVHCRGVVIEAPPRRSVVECLRRQPWGKPRQTPLHAVMTPSVLSVTADVSIESATERMLSAEVSGLPVVDGDGAPIGMLTRLDLLRYAHEGGDGTAPAPVRRRLRGGVQEDLRGGYHEEPVTTVADAMTPLAFTLDEESALGDAAALMACEGVHRLPVVDREGRLVGILSALDVVRWFADHRKDA